MKWNEKKYLTLELPKCQNENAFIILLEIRILEISF